MVAETLGRQAIMEINAAKIHHPTGDIFYVTPNPQCEFRVRSLFTKEPDTIAWIAEFNPGEVFIDVGANVGMYSIWAAKTTGARVIALEPESQNFALLCQNIAINQTDVLAFPMAVSDTCSYAPLYLSDFGGGGSCHTFGEKVNFKGDPMQPAFIQGSVSTTLDALLAQGAILTPDHIKIDVDGLEHKVINGALECLSVARTVLVEIDSTAGRSIPPL
jgi:FkbM family methyltransferase